MSKRPAFWESYWAVYQGECLHRSTKSARLIQDISPSTSAGPSSGLRQQLTSSASGSGPAIPWRRANVRHTSNELYVDLVESLNVTLAPSGRPLAAFANGSILVTSKLSGIPDLILNLSASGGKLGMEKAIELPVFHACVRLNRWKEKPGELSFVPPDGKFVLAGYEVNLMPTTSDLDSWSNANLQLPVNLEVSKSLGPDGADFEVKVILSSNLPGAAPSKPVVPRGSGRSTPIFGASPSVGPSIQDVVVHVPMPPGVQNVTDLRASRGEAYFSQKESTIEWRLPTKDTAQSGIVTLRCTIATAKDEANGEDASGFAIEVADGDYDENETYQSGSSQSRQFAKVTKEDTRTRDQQKIDSNASLMPSSATVSFGVKGWLASGIKVDGLAIDTKRSRGLGEGVKPYKGVKYLTVSKRGVETRC